MLVRLTVWVGSLRARLWLIPTIGAVAAAATAWLLVSIDRSLASDAGGFFVFGGGPESARSILSTIAAAMLTFTGLVFSVTMLVLQLASSQISPLVTRTYLRDRKNQVVLAIFVATFVYALLVLREVRSGAEAEFVPSIAVWWAFVLLLASIGAFIFYIDHMAHAMRVETAVRQVGEETRGAIDRCYADPVGSSPTVDLPLPPVTTVVPAADRPGTLQAIDVPALERLARDAGGVIEIVPTVGDAVPSGAPLARVRGDARVDAEAVRGALAIGDGRTMDQDPAFGLRQLVDIAVRALSPGTNDPTTAALAIDAIHDLLRRLGQRAIPGRQRVDEDGALRVIVPVRDWDDLVRLACAEIRTYGSDSIQVLGRLHRMLDDLEATVPDDRRAVLRRQRDLLPESPAADR